VGLAPLAQSPHLRRLETLSIDPNADRHSVRALAASPLAAACRPGLGDLLARREWPQEWQKHLENLHNGRLTLWHQRLGDGPIARLAGVSGLARVRELDVGGNDLTVAGLRALLASPHLTGLRLLRLSFNDRLGDEGAELVANCPNLAGLRSLKMSFCAVGDSGAKALAASPYLIELRVLKLWSDRDNPISDEGARAIAQSPNFRRLVALRLRDNAIGDAGAIALAESPHLTDLMHLYISGNRFGPEGEEALRRRFGGRVGFFDGDPYTVGL
jgi:Ran GTPase-activating protein (RanGAP) involved in mRNA processing and transport